MRRPTRRRSAALVAVALTSMFPLASPVDAGSHPVERAELDGAASAGRGATRRPAVRLGTPPSSSARRPAPSAAPSGRVLLLGDSIATEVHHFLEPLLRRRDLRLDVAASGGTAPCDWHGRVAAGRGDLLVISFIGNRISPCSLIDGRERTTPEIVELYRRDIARHVDRAIADGARVVLLTQPPTRVAPRYAGSSEALNRMLQQLAAQRPGVQVVDAAAALRGRDGGFAERLPCRPGDVRCDRDGTVAVRNADGVHLCPTDTIRGGVQGRCPVWSSGAWRLAQAIADGLPR